MDTFDYQRSSVPARLPSQRATSLATHQYESQSQENAPSPISIRAVLRASRRYWWLILALWTVGTSGFAAAVYLKVKPQYHASSLLKVEPTMIDLYGVGTREGAEPYMQTHVELIKSNNVLDAAAKDPRAAAFARIRNAEDPIQELGKVIGVGIRPNTHIIEVSMISPSRDEAAILVNAVVDSFLEENKGWSNVATKMQITKLSDYRDKLDLDIKKTEREMKERVARGNTSERVVEKTRDTDSSAKKDKNAAESMEWTVDNYRKVFNECWSIRIELLAAEASLEEARRTAEEVSKESSLQDSQPRSSPQLERRLRSDPELVDLLKQRSQAMDHLNKVRGNSRDQGDAAITKARDNANRLIRSFNAALDRKRQLFQDELSASLNGADPFVEVKKLETTVKNLTTRKKALEEELNKTKLENTKQQSDELELLFLREDHSSLKEMQEMVQRKLEQLNFDALAGERIRRLNEARPEGQPISDKRMQYMAMAPIGVLGAVLGLVVLLEIRSGRVADTEILSSRMRHEVFSIAPLPNIRPGIGMDTSEKAEQRLARFVQSLDHLRVALCEGGTNGEGRCVMITSATGGEGKTTLSAHLAARCANAGTSTLLIDADMRRASLGRLLDVPPGMGLGDVLAGEVELDSALITVQAGGFHFLSAGTPGIDPTRVLKSTRLAELIGQLRQMYDLVIIDTPPVLPVADALILGRWADGAVMAARYDASRLPLVERANRQIIAAGIPVLGVVVNGVKGQDQAYGSYSYNYSYPGRQDHSNEPANAS